MAKVLTEEGLKESAPSDFEVAMVIHEQAVSGMDEIIHALVTAINNGQPIAIPFRAARYAMETMRDSVPTEVLFEWGDIALAVARVTTGETQVEAYALAYKLVHKLT